MPLKSYYKSSDGAFTLLLGDCRQLLSQFDFQFDMIFADPPYFLSNGGISVQSGKIVVTIQNWRIDYHVSFPYLRAKLKT